MKKCLEPQEPSEYEESLLIDEHYPEDGLQLLAEWDSADGPEWSIPREWVMRNQYDC
jgi:hypothetical protein